MISITSRILFLLPIKNSRLVNKSFKIRSWIPLIVLKFLLFNSSLLKIRIPVLAINCSCASSVTNKARNLLTLCGFHLHLRIPLTFWGIHLQLRNAEQLAILACYANHEATNVSRNFTFQLFVSGFYGNLLVKSTYI